MQPLGGMVEEVGGAEAIISLVDADGSGEVDEEELTWAIGSMCEGDYYYGDYDYWYYYYSDWSYYYDYSYPGNPYDADWYYYYYGQV